MTHACMVSYRPPEGPLILDDVSFASCGGHSFPKDGDTGNGVCSGPRRLFKFHAGC